MKPHPSSPSTKPRVLYVVSHPIHYQAPMIRHIAAHGQVDIHAVFARNDGVSAAYFDKDFQQKVFWEVPLTDGYSHEFLPAVDGGSGLRQRGVSHLRHLWSLLRIFRTYRPDAVWVHGYDSRYSLLLLAACKLTRTPVLARADVEESDAHGGPKVRVAKDRILKLYFPLIDAFLAVGLRNAKFYRDRGVPQRKIFMTPYGIDNHRFGEGSGTLASTKTPTFLFSGKLIPRKRPQDAIEALRLLSSSSTSAPRLVFVGSGELEPQLRRMTEEYGLQEQVTFAGFVNQRDIVSYYQNASALLLISERERWGLVANEAMAAGCPVISYEAVGCSHDLVRDDETGYVVDTGDVPALADAMSRLLDRAHQQAMFRAARAHVAKYSFDEVAQGLTETLRSLGVLSTVG